MDIYTYTDENAKVYSNNQLVVSFNFPSEVETETAINVKTNADMGRLHLLCLTKR